MTLPSADPGIASGLAFPVPDLLLAQAWAEFHELSMVVELNGYLGSVACDEMLAFYAKGREAPRWLMWRTQSGVAVEHVEDSRTRGFESVVDALEELVPASP